MFPPGADEPPQECHLKHPAQMKGAVFPAAAILQVACAGEKAAAKEDTGLAGPAVSAAGAPMVQRTVPLFNGLPASIDRGDSLDIRARQRALRRTQIRARTPNDRSRRSTNPTHCCAPSIWWSAEMAPIPSPW